MIIKATTPTGHVEVFPSDWSGFRGSFASVILNAKRVTVEFDSPGEGVYVYEPSEEES